MGTNPRKMYTRPLNTSRRKSCIKKLFFGRVETFYEKNIGRVVSAIFLFGRVVIFSENLFRASCIGEFIFSPFFERVVLGRVVYPPSCTNIMSMLDASSTCVLRRS